MLLKLAYSNFWISLTAAGHVFLTQFCLGLALDGRPAAVALATMMMVYTFAKAIHLDAQADLVNDPERTEFLLRNRVLLVGVALALYAACLLWLRTQGCLWLGLFPFVTALLYDLKWLPRSWRYRRLKDIPGVKSAVVAFTWSVVVGFGPVLLASTQVPTLCLLGWLLWNCLLWFVNTVYFDLGDMRGDELEGTRTLPLVLGFRGTLILLWSLTGLAAVLLELLRQQGGLAPGAIWAHGVEVYTLGYLVAARRPDTDLGFWCDVVADGQGIAAALLVLAALLLGN
jgi:4-hydroxybenzoate polyprenyltransferase